MNIQSSSPAEAPQDASDGLLTEIKDGIACLTLNRPAARNALSRAMIAQLTAQLAQIADDDDIRAVVISGAGAGFCAGHDLREMTAHRADSDGGRAFFRETMDACATMMQAIVHLPKPVIAAAHGIATAAGCQLVATCDLAIAADTASFATPGVHIGLFCSTPMVALSRNVPRKHAMEMLFDGEPISAKRAAEIGLVNRVVPAGEERAAAIELARQIASKSQLILKIGKTAFYRQAEMPLSDAYAYAAEVMTENMMARDAEEGICAFLDKREPQWEDR